MKLGSVPLSTLSFDPANLRKHGRRNLDAIKASLRRFGQQKPIVVDAKGIVLAGNGTLAAAQELGWTEIKIVRTDLAGTQATAFGIADNRSAELAEWDEKLGDVLASLKAEDFPLDEIGFDEKDLADLDGNSREEPYTQKVDAPVYEPKGERPSLAELVDFGKAEDLIREIETSKLPVEVQQFLKTAAARHVIFNYEKIAEYYCHADKQTQQLMENSALVIIDFKKAMQLGYVQVKSEIQSALENSAELNHDEA